MAAKKHNWTWFKNRIGKKIYCDDHEHKNVDWTECKGIVAQNEHEARNLMANQERGIIFS